MLQDFFLSRRRNIIVPVKYLSYHYFDYFSGLFNP